MGKKSPAMPTPPDPIKTAAAQTATNISTAQANAILGNVNQVTPDGSLTYSQSGNKFIEDATAGQAYWRGPNGEIQSSAPMTTATGTTRKEPIYRMDGGKNGSGQQVLAGYKDVKTGGGSMPQAGWTQVKGYYLPQYTATQTLSAAQQAIKDQNDAASLNLGQIANNQSAFLEDYLSKPVSLDNDAVEGRLLELGRKRLDPVLADRQADLDTRLANQGIRLGSTAYDTATRQNNEASNDAYNSLILGGRQQSIQEILTERNQPLNEISALMSGSQVSQPQWAQTNMPTVPTTDYAGLVQSNYQNQVAAYQAKQASKPNILGGLFGLGAAALGNTSLFGAGAAASDRRLKVEIEPLGSGPLGLMVYAFRYIWGGPRRIGLMADEVARVLPEAVLRMANGFLAVDYAKVQEASK